MNEEECWDLIARSRAHSADCEAQAGELVWLLSARSAADIRAFEDWFTARRLESYRWDLWGAAYVINGSCSDDGFEYFRCWLIGQGREVYEAALRDPDSLAEVLTGQERDVECEALRLVAYEAYEDLMGEPMPTGQSSFPMEPAGEPWEEDDLPARFPRLSAIF